MTLARPPRQFSLGLTQSANCFSSPLHFAETIRPIPKYLIIVFVNVFDVNAALENSYSGLNPNSLHTTLASLASHPSPLKILKVKR